MQVFEDFLRFLDGLLGSAAYFPIVLLGVGIFFTLDTCLLGLVLSNKRWRTIARICKRAVV